MVTPGCGCDDCVRKFNLVLALQASTDSAPLAAQLQEELARHSRRAGEEATCKDRLAICKPNSRRPWLAYDADALLPSPFDVFLLNGACPRVTWQPSPQGPPPLTYIVGCGRSGTTLLAELLSHCDGVAFMNEPRQLWIPLVPEMDVWSVCAPGRQGRLCFAASDADASLVAALDEAYGDIAALVGGSALLVEKLPEHAFRLPFLAALRPGCTVVHVLRDGLDVARSIAAIAPGAWHGAARKWKWRCVAEFTAELELREEFLQFLEGGGERCQLARGLVEWAASVTAARKGAETSALRWLEVRYEELVAEPQRVLGDVAGLLGLDAEAATRHAEKVVVRRPTRDLTESEGEVLRALRGSRVEILLRECGQLLPSAG